MAAKTYREILDEYERAKAFGSFQGSLKDYSTQMNQTFENTDYEQGLRDGWLPRADTYLDKAIEYTGFPEVSKNIFGAIGGAFGQRDAGERVGESLPRSLVNMAPMLLGGPVGILGTGALMGADTYAKTGSPGAGVVSGLSGVAMPAFARGGGAIAAKLGFDTIGQYVGSQLGGLVPNAAAAYKQQQILAPDQPFDAKNFAVETLLSQIPFTAYDVPGLQRQIAARKAIADVQRPAAPEVKPYVPPTSTPEAHARLKVSLDQIAAVQADTTLTPDQKSAKVAKALKVLETPVTETKAKAPVENVGQTEVVLRGRSDKLPNGQYRVLVDDAQSAASLNVNPGDTVFVNDTNAEYDPATNRMVFKTTVDKIRPGKFKLGEQDFGIRANTEIDTTQPELPVQPEPTLPGADHINQQADALQARINEARARLTTPEVAALTEMGVSPEKVTELTTAPETDQTAIDQLRLATAAYEITQQNEAAARAKAVAPIATADEAVGLVGNSEQTVKEIEDLGTQGYTFMQAVEKIRLKQATKEVDQATVESNVLKKTARQLAAEKYQESIVVGNKLIKAYTDAANIPGAEGPQKEIGQVILKYLRTDTGALQDEKFLGRVSRVVHKWATGEYGEVTAARLQKALSGTVRTAKLKAGRKVSYLVDGKRVYGDEATLNKYIAENGLAEQGWRALKSDKGRQRYIGKLENDTSLDRTVGEGTTTLGDIVSEPTSTPPIATEKFKPTTEAELVSHIDTILKDPRDFANDIVGDEVSQEQLLSTIEELTVLREAIALKEEYGIDTEAYLTELNRRLKDRGVAEIADRKELKETMRRGLGEVLGYVKRNYSPTLGSVVPGDRALAEQLGMYEPNAQKLFTHIAGQKDLLGPIADLVEAQLPFVDWNDLRLIRPGEREWAPGGWSYTDLFGFDPQIVIPHEPTQENLFKWLTGAAHEFVHYNERKLADRNDIPAKEYAKRKIEVLEVLRGAKDLPKPVRDLIAKSIAEKHWQRLRNDDPNVAKEWVKALGPYKEYFHFVYAMQHPTELTSVLFSDPVAMDIARRTKMPAKGGVVENALQWFSRAINRLFGGRPASDNAFYQLTQSYDNYLTGGTLKHTYNGLDFIRTQLLEKGTRPEALASRLETIDRLYARGNLRDSLTGYVREGDNGLLPITAEKGEVNQAIRTALTTASTSMPADTYRAAMGLLADEVPAHKELLFRMQEDLAIVRSVIGEVETGAIPGSIPKDLKKNIAQAAVHLNAFKKAIQKQENAIDAWTATERMTVDGWESAQKSALMGERLFSPPDVPEVETIRQKLGLARIQGKGMNFIERNLLLTQHLKELHPALKSAIQGVMWEQANANQRANALNLSFIYDPATKKPNEQILAVVNRVSNNETLVNATSDLLRYANREQGGRGLDMNADFVKNTLGRFNPQDRRAITTTIDAIVNRHKVWYSNVLPKALGQLNHANTAQLILTREPGMLPEQARQLTAQLYDGLSKVVDPAQGQIGLAQLQALSAQMQPETYQAALQHAQGLSTKTKEAIDKVAARPVWVTEQRYGEDQLHMLTPDGKKFRDSGDRATLDKRRMDLERKGYKFLDYVPAEDRQNRHFGINEDILRTFEQLESENENVLKNVLSSDPDTLEKVLTLQRNSGSIRASLAAMAPIPGPTRRYAAGREFINMVDNSNQFYIRMNNWLKHRLTRAETNVEMQHPEIAGNSEYKRLVDQHVQNFLTPDNPTARKLVEGVYFFRLGADLGQAVIEGTQQLTTGLAELIAETGSVTDAFALSYKMNKMLAQHKLTKKWSDPEHARLSELLSQYGIGSLATWHDFVDPDTNAVLDANKGVPGHVTDKIKNFSRSLSTKVSRYNDVVITHAAFDLARKQGMDFDSAVRFAVDVKNRSLYTSGKAGRSVGFWSIKSRPVPQLLGALQNYTLGWFGQMGTNFVKGFGKNPPAGLTPTQRQGARKAFAYSLIAQAALAGGLGLPGVGQGLALLGQATGVDVKGLIRTGLSDLFNEDQEYGGVMTNLAMRGVGAAGLPIDPSNRTSISIPFIGVDPYKGFSMENLLGGATGASVKDAVAGLVAFAQGDMYSAQTALPSALKRPAQLWWGEGDIRDKRGALLHETTPSEDIRMVFGLQPSRVQAARDTAEAIRKSEDAAAKRKQAAVDKVAALYRQGKQSEAQQALVELKMELPETDIKSLVRSVAERVQAQTLPYDPRQTASTPSLNMATGLAPTQQRRRELDSSVFRAFGVKDQVSAKQSREDQLVDQMMSKNPFLTRREARRLLSERQPALPSYTGSGLPAYLGGSLE